MQISLTRFADPRSKDRHSLTYHRTQHCRPGLIECLSPAEWLVDDGAHLAGRLLEGYRRLAENLVDELYLVYHPAPRTPGQTEKPTRTVPDYVLEPISPAAPEIYLDVRSISRKRRHVTGFGGMHFADVATLTPTLHWEAFPRPFDPTGDVQRIESVTCELRIYEAGLIDEKFAALRRLLHEVTGLLDTHYRVDGILQPCNWYFWTVRAGFHLGGVRCVTEWAGAFQTAGGEFSPSWSRRNSTRSIAPWPASYLYYPFRTPAADASAACPE